MSLTPNEERINPNEERIKQLSDKSTQILLFLSFALVVVATLKDKSCSSQFALREAMRWWSWALFPVLLGVLPIKEFNMDPQPPDRWFKAIRWVKVGLLWIAVGLIMVGAVYFALSLHEVFQD